MKKQEAMSKKQETMSKEKKTKSRRVEEKSVALMSVEEIESAVADEIKKRQKMELESKLGKLKKRSDLVTSRRRIAQLLTKKQELGKENKRK